MKKPFPDCPVCGNTNLIFYDTAEDEKSGRYKCPGCGRDTIWKEFEVINGDDFLKSLGII